jgi:2-polyprenyl-6-hydroxyphenyl methylase/3-demethylubiquinone-9 3-methyltransferase
MEKRRSANKSVNNAFYDELEELWIHGDAHPIALLRAENRLRIPWIIQTIEERCGKNKKILDIGCGAGFLTNALAKEHHEVVGVDLSSKSLEIAKKSDITKKAAYLQAPGEQLPFPDNSFDVISALDFLEHIEEPQRVIQEASRVLKPGGLFFFHTFNRNFLSYLLIIKGVEFFVPNTPPQMHLLRLFIKPEELSRMCQMSDLQVVEMRGMRPSFGLQGLWKLVLQRRIADDFRFLFCPSLKTGYCGFCLKCPLS